MFGNGQINLDVILPQAIVMAFGILNQVMHDPSHPNNRGQNQPRLYSPSNNSGVPTNSRVSSLFEQLPMLIPSTSNSTPHNIAGPNSSAGSSPFGLETPIDNQTSNLDPDVKDMDIRITESLDLEELPILSNLPESTKRSKSSKQ